MVKRDPKTLPAHLRHYCIECNADVVDRDDAYCTFCKGLQYDDEYPPVQGAYDDE